MSTTVSNYKIYCTTENAYIAGWSTTPPTVCFNNNTHTVNVDSVQLIETISDNIFSVKEDKISIGRNTILEAISVTDVAFGTTKVVDYVVPLPFSLYSFSITPDSTNKGDTYSIIVNDETTMGLIGENIDIGATSLKVPAAFIAYGSAGFYADITDGTNTDELGMIKTLDTQTGIVTFVTPTTHAYSASNTLFRMTIKVINNIRIGGPGVYKFFEDVIGGAPVPVGTRVKFIYTNNSTSGADKELTLYLTCLY